MSSLDLAKKLLAAVAAGSAADAAGIISVGAPLVGAGASILFPTERPNIGGIELNCTLSETHGFQYDVTQVPVESGAMLTDHIQEQPTPLTLVGVISPRPDNIADQFRNLLGFGGQPGGGRKYNSEDRANTSWSRLITLAKSKTPFEVSTALRVYKNMVFVSLDHEELNTDALIFTAELIEIIEVDIRRERYLEDTFKDDGRATDVFAAPAVTEMGPIDVLGAVGNPFGVIG